MELEDLRRSPIPPAGSFYHSPVPPLGQPLPTATEGSTGLPWTPPRGDRHALLEEDEADETFSDDLGIIGDSDEDRAQESGESSSAPSDSTPSSNARSILKGNGSCPGRVGARRLESTSSRRSVTFDPRTPFVASSGWRPDPLREDSRHGSIDIFIGNQPPDEMPSTESQNASSRQPLVETSWEKRLSTSVRWGRAGPGGKEDEQEEPEWTTRFWSHYKVWAIVLAAMVAVFFLLVMIPLSHSVPLMHLQRSEAIAFSESGRYSITANRSSGHLFVSVDDPNTQSFSLHRYSKDMFLEGDSPVKMGATAGFRCGLYMNDMLSCCKNHEDYFKGDSRCFFSEHLKMTTYEGKNNISKATFEESTVVDAEYHEGSLRLLLHSQSSRRYPYEIFDVSTGARRNMTYLSFPFTDTTASFTIRRGYLEGGELVSFVEDTKGCEERQYICRGEKCTEIRTRVCGFEAIWPSPSTRTVLVLHCEHSTRNVASSLVREECRLSQLLLASMAVISRSAPFTLQFSPRFSKQHVGVSSVEASDPKSFSLYSLHFDHPSESWSLNRQLYTLVYPALDPIQ